MVGRRWLAAGALVFVAGGCGGPLRGWHHRAERIGPCEQHRRIVVRDADGALREVEHPRELGDAAWDQVEEGYYQITRGVGGWWLSERGYVSYVRGQERGKLLWLPDGQRPPEKLTFGRYVGVVEIGDEMLAVRGECPFGVRDGYSPYYTVVERWSQTDAGWTRAELRRIGGLCPFNAIADEGGHLLVLGVVTKGEEPTMDLFRVEPEGPPRTLGRIPDEEMWNVNVQTSWSRPGELLLSRGWSTYAPEVSEEWEPPPGRVLRLGETDEEELRSSYLVRRCAVGSRGPRWTPSPPRTPERDLGITSDPPRDDQLADVRLRLDYGDLRAVVDELRSRGEPVSFEIRGIDLRGQAGELLRLPPGSRLIQVQSLSDAELHELRSARPDLFAR